MHDVAYIRHVKQVATNGQSDCLYGADAEWCAAAVRPLARGPSPVVAQTLDGLVDQARLFGPEHNAAGAIAEKAWAYCPAFISAT